MGKLAFLPAAMLIAALVMLTLGDTAIKLWGSVIGFIAIAAYLIERSQRPLLRRPPMRASRTTIVDEDRR